MASINASTSGAGGIITTADNTGTLNLQSGGTTIATISSNGLISKGVTDGSNASSGYVGEYIVSTVATPGITLSGSTAANVTSISLTAGDWDVTGSVYYIGSGTTSTLNWIMCNVQTTSASLGAGTVGMFIQTPLNSGVWTQADNGGLCGPNRISLTTTTTIYLVTRAGYTGGTIQCYGQVRARRVR